MEKGKISMEKASFSIPRTLSWATLLETIQNNKSRMKHYHFTIRKSKGIAYILLFVVFSLLPLLSTAQQSIRDFNKSTLDAQPYPCLYADTVRPKTATLLFVGDLMQHGPQIKQALQPDGSYRYDECFEQVKPYIESADLAIGNLEVTLGGEPYQGYPCFSAPDDYLWAIKETGFDVLTTSNNHCLDRGKKGLERTLLMTDSLGFHTLGTYRDDEERSQRYPLVLTVNGIRVAFLTYTYGMNGFEVSEPNVVNVIDKTVMEEDIRAAKAMHPDVIIAIMLWGTEYRLEPDSYQRHYAEWLLENGVDHIIGGHPHVIEPTEWVKEEGRIDPHLVVYSQGNFISNMSLPNTFDGTMITLSIQKVGLVTRISNYDCKVVRTIRPNYKLTIVK